MTVAVSGQAMGLLGSVVLGLALGLGYDCLRIVRRRIPGRWMDIGLDLLFWLGASAALFLWSVRSGGVVRLYIALGMLLGGWVWFCTLSRIFLAVGFHLADWMTAMFRFLLSPARFASRIAKKFAKNLKNHFLYWKKWFMINLILTGEKLPLPSCRKQFTGGESCENRQGKSDYQSRYFDSVGVSVDYTAQRPGQASVGKRRTAKSERTNRNAGGRKRRTKR